MSALGAVWRRARGWGQSGNGVFDGWCEIFPGSSMQTYGTARLSLLIGSGKFDGATPGLCVSAVRSWAGFGRSQLGSGVTTGRLNKKQLLLIQTTDIFLRPTEFFWVNRRMGLARKSPEKNYHYQLHFTICIGDFGFTSTNKRIN